MALPMILTIAIGVSCGQIKADDVADTNSAPLEDPIRRIESLQHELRLAEREVLRLLRESDEQIERIQSTPSDARTQEDVEQIGAAVTTKLRTLKTLAMRSHKGVEYMRTHLLYTPFSFPIGWMRNEEGIFREFPCAHLLSRGHERSAVQAVLYLAKNSDMTQAESIFCARFLYHVANNPDRTNALGKNVLLQELAKLEGVVKIVEPRRASHLQRRLERLRGNVDRILGSYALILENDKRAMTEFQEAKQTMRDVAVSNWKGQ